jgi:NTE family protein
MGSAVVLGGGGITGIAWEIGVVQALREGGVDPGEADLILGTSAGSVVGTLLAAGADLDALASEHLTSGVDLAELGADFDAEGLAAAVIEMMAGAESFQEVRARIGTLALSVGADEEERLAIFEARLPVHEWPEHALWITGVDTATGEPAVWSRASGVPLLRAVAASCAVPGVWPPVTIDGRRYMDGGVRSTNNADLVAGSNPVIVLAPYTIGLEGSLDAEVDRLTPARVAVVTPNQAALEAIGPNPLDPVRRAEAHRAGLDQGRAELERVSEVWAGQAT